MLTSLTQPLTYLINLSFQQGIFSEAFKTAKQTLCEKYIDQSN